jgi:enterochelin esterase-like enzyme
MRRFLALVVFSIGAFSLAAKTNWNNPPRRAESYIQHGTFRSSVLKSDVGYNICLPPEYAAQSKQRFPVIYYLHGYEGNESSYLDYAKYWRDACKRFGPSILVFVNGGETSFFCDSPDGSVPGETLVIKELIPHIDEKFRTVAMREGRSLHGYSMGGFGALKLAFKFPDKFGSVVAYGATLSDAADFKKHLPKVYAQMFGNDAKRFAGNDPLALAENNATAKGSRPAINLIVGTKDDFLVRHHSLHQKLDQLKIQNTYEEVRGAGHDKDDLYKAAALRAFEFSAKHFERQR